MEARRAIVQSAVIPYRRVGTRLEVLLVTSRKGRRWVVPKGFVEPTLTPAQSAAKEAWEEAGVSGRVQNEPVGEYAYVKLGDVYVVTLYLMCVTEMAEKWPERFRLREWLSVEEASERIDEAELSDLILDLPRFVKDEECDEV